ncbi:MAG: type II toxin-antitoxin system HicA family toxin [Clostridia bacterium]
MPRATKDVERALSSKGFTLEKKRDHNYYFIYKDGKKTKINTKVSHGTHKDISDGLLNQMMKQMKLPKKEFNEYMNCTFSKEEYLNFLEGHGYI